MDFARKLSFDEITALPLPERSEYWDWYCANFVHGQPFDLDQEEYQQNNEAWWNETYKTP